MTPEQKQKLDEYLAGIAFDFSNKHTNRKS